MDRVNVAGVKSGKEKKPSPVVVAERTKPLSSPVSVTLTAAITAPPESWTVPDSAQEIFWAGSKAGSMSTRASFCKIPPPVEWIIPQRREAVKQHRPLAHQLLC